MTKYRSLLACAVALAIGWALGGVDAAHAESNDGGALATGSNAIGTGSAVGAGTVVEATFESRATLGQCNTTRTAYRIENNGVNTNSTSYTVMPSMHRRVTFPGTTPRCVIVEFIGELTAGGSGDLIQIRAWISGVGESLTPQVTLVRANPSWQTHSMRFIFPSVPPGDRMVRIDWRANNSNPVSVFSRVLIIDY